VAAVEKSARMDGAEEVYIAVAPELDQSWSFLRLSGGAPLGRRFAVRATVAYKGSWVRKIRTMCRDSRDAVAIRRTDAWFTELIGMAAAGKLVGSVAQQISTLSDAVPEGWFVEAAAGTRPLAVLDSPPASDLPIVLTLKMKSGGVPWIGAGLIAAV